MSTVWERGEKASALIAGGRPAAALPLLASCAAEGAGWALLLRARAKHALRRHALAEADVTRAFDLDPDCGWIFGLGGTVPPEGRRLHAANRAFRCDPSCYAVRAFHGKLEIMAGRREEGLAHLDWAAKKAPKRPYLFAWRGEARRRLGDLKGARADARRALALDPRHAVAWTTLAAVERLSGRPADALTAARRAARLAPSYEIAPLEAARACLALGDAVGVLNWLERAARRSSRLGWVNLGEGKASPAPPPQSFLDGLKPGTLRGRVLAWCAEEALSRGDAERARELLNVALTLARAHPFGRTWYGEARLALGDAAGAERTLSSAAAGSPRYARAWAALARARLDLGRPRPALAASERALNLEPDWAWALYLRGRANAALGRKPAALRDFDAALALDGRFEQARTERARLA